MQLKIDYSKSEGNYYEVVLQVIEKLKLKEIVKKKLLIHPR